MCRKVLQWCVLPAETVSIYLKLWFEINLSKIGIMSQLVLVRHGETAKNSQGILHTSFDNETLNTKGISQINQAAKYLSTYKLNCLFSSKEKRAIESAVILSEKLDIPFSEVTNLHERNWGDLSGKPWSEIRAILDSLSFNERFTYRPPNGETWQEFEYRLVETIKKLVIRNKGKNLAVVTHGGAIRALMPFLRNLPKEESFNYDPHNASIAVFEILSPDKYIPI